LVGIACLTATALSSSALVSVVSGTASAFDRIDTEFDVIMGPKSSGLSVLLGALGAREPSTDVLPYSLIRFMERKIEPRHIVPLHACGLHRGSTVFGTDDRYLNRPEGLASPTLVSGRWFEREGEAVVGVRAAEEKNLKVGDRIRVSGLVSPSTAENLHWETELEVVGIVDCGGEPMDDAIFTSMDSSREYYSWTLQHGLTRPTKNDEAVTYWWVSIEPDQMPLVKRWMHEMSVAQMVETREEIAFLRSLTGGGRLASWVLCGCVILLAVLGIAVLANARFESLGPELGLLRALGYPKSSVAAWIFFEIVIVTGTALCISIPTEALVVGWIDLPHALSLTESPTPWPTAWNLTVWLIVALASPAASAGPLYRLYRTNVQTSMQGF
jgi:hypothetical protein